MCFHSYTYTRKCSMYRTIPFECNKNEIANAYGAYNLCHLFLLYTQYFLSIYDSLRYKIESNKRSGKQQFSILVSVKMKRETRRRKNNNNISDIHSLHTSYTMREWANTLTHDRRRRKRRRKMPPHGWKKPRVLWFERIYIV